MPTQTKTQWQKGDLRACGHSVAFNYHPPGTKPHHSCLKCDDHTDYRQLENIHIYSCCNCAGWLCPHCDHEHHTLDQLESISCERCGYQFEKKLSGLYEAMPGISRFELLMETV